ncbi:MAG TPA: M23 family metallopeptidase [Rhizomicrobium sp.]|jgi:murein DD-endopeptidase MepM/ murein hydrolase activator NlpD|nr:M23 family metallopeptidase [Rhizomicrobium sp.]
MGHTLVERVWAWLHATFPERQIYIRSDGRVQFFTCGATLQATCAGLSLIFLGWVAFASVNVIFKDRIIAAKDHRYQQMQGTYENRIADLQLSYDELNNGLISAEDRFKAAADEVEAKQKSVAALLGNGHAFEAAFVATNGAGLARGAEEDVAQAPARRAETASDSLGGDTAQPPASVGYSVTVPRASHAYGSGASELTIMPDPVDPQPRTAHPTRASMLDVFTNLADAVFSSGALSGRALKPAAPLARPAALEAIDQQTRRIAQLGRTETSLLKSLDRKMSERTGGLRKVLAGLGAARLPASGGPMISTDSIHLDGVSDREFTSAYIDAAAQASSLQSLVTELHHVPLTTPVHGGQFEVTSGFGPRVDPFTGRVAFHPGVDFAGPWGSTVGATAPGVVVSAGYRGGYGNMVELDHGYGFHTRYGHLAAILVRTGMRVEKGAAVGRLGSTGRSTGPHVHYEVWLANALKDPSRYIAAGRQIAE